LLKKAAHRFADSGCATLTLALVQITGHASRDLLDHVIVLNERHLKRLMTELIRYYHDDRTHLGLDKQTPAGRTSATGTTARAKVISISRLGGLHYHYNLAA
jgi:hypothetical protein